MAFFVWLLIKFRLHLRIKPLVNMIKNTISIVLLIILVSSCINNSLEDSSPIDCSTSTLDLTFVTADANCGLNDGTIKVTVSGGEPPYSYSLDNSVGQDSGVFEGLASGNYDITVTDNITCSFSKEISVANSGGFQATGSVTDSGCKTTNGTFTVTPTGGNLPYEFELNGGGSQSNGSFSNLATGEHEVIITDASGCDFSIIKTILTGISYTSSIKPIIANNCAISGCHNGSNNLPDFSVFSNVQGKASSIKTRTQSGSMPRNGSLTQAEKDAIACWVDDGAKDN